MSFLGFGGSRPQPSSAEKIAAVENEMKIIFDMQNRYGASRLSSPRLTFPLPLLVPLPRHTLLIRPYLPIA